MHRIVIAICLTTACTVAEHGDRAATPTRDAAGTVGSDSVRAKTADSIAKHEVPAAKVTPATSATPARQATPTPAAADAAPRTDPGPTAIRALYVNRWATQSKRRMAKLIAAADSTE